MLQFNSILCVSLLLFNPQCVFPSVIELNDLIQAVPLDYFDEEFFNSLVAEEPLDQAKADHAEKVHNSVVDSFEDKYNETFPVINTNSLGLVMGKRMKSYFQKDFIAFQGIPYAEVPTRFRMSTVRTEPLSDGDSYYDATYLRPKCPQASMIVSGPAGREDCLHLSIYAPEVTIHNDPAIHSVMVFIHGGAFVSGDASLYVPTKLMDKDVIVVVIQYRLGSLGFLASGTDAAPGNMGLMDQINALRWVKTNIQNFRGDSSKITVFGQSAGGASASWMMFTPLATAPFTADGKDLFARIIAESGSAIEEWTLDPNPQESLYLHAEAVNCPTEGRTNDEIVSCMSDLDIEIIVNGFNYVYSNDRANGGLGFKGLCPVIQAGEYFSGITDDADRVIIEHPLKSAAKGEHLKVQIMTGSVRDEGSLVAGLAWDSFLEPRGLTYNETFMSVQALPFFVHSFGIPDITGTVSNSIRLAYLRDAEMGVWDSMVGGMVDAMGMMFLKSGLWTLSTVISHQSPDMDIYFYSFEFESDDSIFDWYFMSTPDIPMNGGITHADELLYLFHLPSYMNDDERQLTTIKRMTTMWTNFAKYGDPTPDNVTFDEELWTDLVDKWEPFTWDGKKFMLMQDNWTMETDFTLRWNYNSLGEGRNATFEAFEIDEESSTSTLPENDSSLSVTVITLSVTCGILFVCLLVLVMKVFNMF